MNNPYRPDDGERVSEGVVVSFHRLEDGQIRLVFDEVRQMMMLDAIGWLHEKFYASAEYQKERFEELDLSKDELTGLAENFILRLIALEKGGLSSDGYM